MNPTLILANDLGYPHRVLKDGIDNAEIKAAYDRAKTSGSSERVERWQGNGKDNSFERAYAMTLR